MLNERQGVTVATFAFATGLLLMAREDPALWEVELFKTLLTAVVVTGILNMILSFHYAANKGDETKAENTGKAFDAITAAASATPAVAGGSASEAADQVAVAAMDKADEIADAAGTPS
jgi:hypothetical protein